MSVFSDDEPLDISLLDAPPPVADHAFKAPAKPMPQLDYATPVKPEPKPNNMYFWWVVVRMTRKLLFVAGLGIFASALGEAIGGGTGDPAAVMGVGAVMVGLAIPLHRRGK